jgi:hypothetical protein
MGAWLARIAGVLLLVGCLISARTAGAQGQTTSCAYPSASVSPSSINAGDTVSVQASGFAPSSGVTLLVSGPAAAPSTTIIASPNGTAGGSVQTLPTDFPGTYTVFLSGTGCGGAALSLTTTFSVAGTQATPTPVVSFDATSSCPGCAACPYFDGSGFPSCISAQPPCQYAYTAPGVPGCAAALPPNVSPFFLPPSAPLPPPPPPPPFFPYGY